MENFINYLNSINYEYQKPAKLFGDQNNKTIKGLKKGYKTLIIYLSPEKQNSLGKNLCPKASEGCKKACLFTSGKGNMPHVINARIRKTEYFLKDRASFMDVIMQSSCLNISSVREKDQSFLSALWDLILALLEGFSD